MAMGIFRVMGGLREISKGRGAGVLRGCKNLWVLMCDIISLVI